MFFFSSSLSRYHSCNVQIISPKKTFRLGSKKKKKKRMQDPLTNIHRATPIYWAFFQFFIRKEGKEESIDVYA